MNMNQETILYNKPKNLSIAGRDTEPLLDRGRLYANRPARPCWPVFLVGFPAIQLWKHKDTRAGDPGTAAQDVHYPTAPKGKTALNDSLTMTIGGVRYTVRSIFAEDGGDFREMLEAAVVSRAARSLSAETTAQRAGISLTGEIAQEADISSAGHPAGQEA